MQQDEKPDYLIIHKEYLMNYRTLMFCWQNILETWGGGETLEAPKMHMKGLGIQKL